MSQLAEMCCVLCLKKTQPGTSAQDIEFLQNIHESSRHMSDLVKGILANEGLEQQGLELGDVDASTLCRDLIAFNDPAAVRKQIEISAQIEPGIVLHADKTRLREALDNYLSNAIKYSPVGKQVSVTLKILPDTRQVEFGVRDQGPGLTEDDKSRLFGKFVKLSARPTGGESSTGLGLSIVKTIIQMHGGNVGCDSTQGQGAYFWARLPLKRK
jgi:signal transduction histidine kinase